MNSTVMTAKSVFNEGLIMDFSPDNTPANSLTSALNATLVTFNGNEMALQNDMGNGRVETAYLPEGYVPVGTCEFGDIIYIVSYNPIEDKSQIGCFPSPERNITSDEQGLPNVYVSGSEFVNNGEIKTTSVRKIIYSNRMNPGDKFVIYSSQLESNADKLTDYRNSSHNYGAFPKMTKIHIISIEDSGKINFLDSTIKWYNDYYIAETDNANKPDIDSYRNLVSSGYSVFQSKVSGKLALLIELERIDAFNCSYSIYTSDNENSRKYEVYFNSSWETSNNDINPSSLVLTKSEWPLGNESGQVQYHRATYGNDGKVIYTSQFFTSDVYGRQPGYQYNGAIFSRIHKLENPGSYEYYLNNNYEAKLQKLLDNLVTDDPNTYPTKIIQQFSQNNRPVIDTNNMGTYIINPSYLDNTDKNKPVYKYVNKDGNYVDCNSITISDDIVNNFFKIPITKPVAEFTIPYKDTLNGVDYYTDISNIVWNYTIAPAMPYGILEDLAISGTIDFSKIGSGYSELVEWRYYVDNNLLTLRWGLEAYPEVNKKITKVAFEFYDNQGICGTYIVKEKPSFSGSFTETLQLGPDGTNPNLIPQKSDEKTIIEHKGDGPYEVTDSTVDLKSLEDAKILLSSSDGYYYNDAGIVYQNLLYLVKIIVTTDSVDSLGNPLGSQETTKIFYRWVWTNTLMNEHFYNIKDFDLITPGLDVLLDTEFYSNEYFTVTNPLSTEGGVLNNSVATNQTTDENVVQETLSWIKQEIKTNEQKDANLYLNIVPRIEDHHNTFKLSKNTLKELQYKIYFGNNIIKKPEFDILFSDSYGDYESVGKLIGPNIVEGQVTENPNKENDKSNVDWFILKSIETPYATQNIKYKTTYSENYIEETLPYIQVQADKAINYENSKGVPLILEGEMYSRITGTNIENTNIEAIKFCPLIGNYDDLKNYNLAAREDNNNMFVYFAEGLVVAGHGDKNPNLSYGTFTAGDDLGKLLISSDGSSFYVEGNSESANTYIGTGFKTANLYAGIFSPIFFCMRDADIDSRDKEDVFYEDERDGTYDLRDNSSNPISINRPWLQQWREYSKYVNGSDKIANCILRKSRCKGERYPNGGEVIWDTPDEVRSLMALTIKDINDKYVLLNNFWSLHPYPKDKPTTQEIYKNAYGSNSIGNIILSFLSKIYYKSDVSELITANIISNYAVCSDYIEKWEKNIIIEIDQPEGTSNIKYLNMSGFLYSDYYEQLKTNFGEEFSRVRTYNADINVNINQVHTVQFDYSLQYNVEYLKQQFGKTSARYFIQSDITGNYKGGLVGKAPFVGTLGVLQNGNIKELVQSDGKFRILTGSIKSPIESEQEFQISTKLLQLFTLKDNQFVLKDMSYSPTNRIGVVAGNSSRDHRGKAWINIDRSRFLIDDPMFKIV